MAPVNIASYCCWSLNLSNFRIFLYDFLYEFMNKTRGGAVCCFLMLLHREAAFEHLVRSSRPLHAGAWNDCSKLYEPWSKAEWFTSILKQLHRDALPHYTPIYFSIDTVNPGCRSQRCVIISIFDVFYTAVVNRMWLRIATMGTVCL